MANLIQVGAGGCARVAALLVFTSGCGHATPRLATSTTRGLCSDRECYEFGGLADSWKVVEHKRTEMSFFNAEVGGVIQGSATCRVETEAAGLDSLSDQMMVGYTERRVRATELVPLVGREALRTLMDVKLDGVPLVLDLYVMKRNGCVFDLSFAAPPDRYERGAADFKQFVRGFSPAAEARR